VIGTKSFIGIVAVAFMIYFISPAEWGVLGLTLLVIGFGLTIMQGKLAHLDILLTRLGPKESLMFWISKTRKIVFQICREEEEGYLGLPEWGLVKVAQDSDYWLYGKPCVIGVQGVAHTIRLEYAKLAQIMQKLGIHTKAELAKFLEVPEEIIIGAKEKGKVKK